MRIGDESGVNPMGEAGSLDETAKEMRGLKLPKTGGKAGNIDPKATLDKIRGRIPVAIARRAEAVGGSPLSLLPFRPEGGSSSKVMNEIMLRVLGRRGS